ncbi:hypothetical protein ACO0LN_25695 [Undibacterium sp. TC9W]
MMTLLTEKRPLPKSPFIFAAAVLGFSALYVQMHLAIFLLVLMLMFGLGLYASYRALKFFRHSFDGPLAGWSWALITLLTVCWAAWFYVPTTSLAEHVDAWIFQGHYEKEVAELSSNLPGNCKKTDDCYADDGKPVYVYFPYALHVPFSEHHGILYIADPAHVPEQARLDKIGGMMKCQDQPLLKHFYACFITGYAG